MFGIYCSLVRFTALPPTADARGVQTGPESKVEAIHTVDVPHPDGVLHPTELGEGKLRDADPSCTGCGLSVNDLLCRLLPRSYRTLQILGDSDH